MAGIEERVGKTGTTWRVYWRQDGTRQTENFVEAAKAEQFRLLVEAHGNRWPPGWRKGRGWSEDDDGRDDRMTFREWAEVAIAQRLATATERTCDDYRRDLIRYVYPHIGHLPVDDLIAKDVLDWYTAVTSLDPPLAPKTISNLHGICSSIMKEAMAHRPPLAEYNPFASRLRELPSVRVEEMVFLTPAEFAMVLPHVPEFYKPLTILLWATGLRFGEATALRVRDFSLDGRRTLTVVRAWKRQRGGTYQVGEPKTPRARRTISISREVVLAVKPLLDGKRPDDLVFPAMEGGQLLNSTYHDCAWAPAVRRAQVCDKHLEDQRETPDQRQNRLARQRATGRRIRPPVARPCLCAGTLMKHPRVHDLRHSHASVLITNPMIAIATASRRLGHASIKTTVDRYGHLSSDQDDVVNKAVDESLL